MPNLDQTKSITQPLHDKLSSITAAIQDVVNIIDTDIMPAVGDVANALSNMETTVASWLDSKDALVSAANATLATLQATIDDLKAKLATASAPAPVLAAIPVAPTAGFTVVPQNMTEITPGVWRSANLGATKSAGGQIAVVQARLATPAQSGQTVKVAYDQTTNVVPDGKKNIKDFRAWPNPSTPYPNDYTGRTLGAGANSITAENGDGVVAYHSSHPTAWTVAYFDMPIKADVKQHIERTIRLSSAPGKADGYAKIVVDGVTVFESDGFMANGPREDFGPQMVYAPLSGDSGPFPAHAYLQIQNLTVAVA